VDDEIKFAGYRTQAHLQTMFTRRFHFTYSMTAALNLGRRAPQAP
jgi:hypothetical protein